MNKEGEKMYKTSFALEEFKKINSFASSFFDEYFIHEDVVIGNSLLGFVERVIFMDDDFKHKLMPVNNIIFPPNYTREKIKDLKKTKMAFLNTNDEITFFSLKNFDNKNLEERSITSEINPEDENMKPGEFSVTKVFNILKQTEIPSYYKTDILRIDGDYTEIDITAMNNKMAESTHFEIENPNDPSDHLLVTKQCFPDPQKIKEMKWFSYRVDDDINAAVFLADYDIATVKSIFHYIPF